MSTHTWAEVEGTQDAVPMSVVPEGAGLSNTDYLTHLESKKELSTAARHSRRSPRKSARPSDTSDVSAQSQRERARLRRITHHQAHRQDIKNMHRAIHDGIAEFFEDRAVLN